MKFLNKKVTSIHYHVLETTQGAVSSMSVGDRFRQNGMGIIPSSGTIIVPKKGGGFYWDSGLALLVGIFTSFVWAPRFLG